MGLFDKIMGEFIDVIEWLDSSDDTMVYRFERHGNEIKMGAKLTVRETQMAVFVNEGEIADIFKPGIYELKTQNMPIMTTLNHWDHAFQSPFKAEVYFFNMRRFVDLKWGTKNPLMLRDAEFGPVRIRSFGTYTIRIDDPVVFLKEIVGTDGYFTVDEVSEQLRNLIVSRFATILGKANIPVLDLAANYEQLSGFIEEKISPEFTAYGLELSKLLVENISLPNEVEAALDKRSSMGITGNLDQYLKYQSANAIENAGQGSSTAGDAMGMGLGLVMAQQMGQNLGAHNTQNVTPPPIPKAQTYHFVIEGAAKGPMTLEQIKDAIHAGSITRETLSWREGMDGWEQASGLEDLKNLFSTTPPPIP